MGGHRPVFLHDVCKVLAGKRECYICIAFLGEDATHWCNIPLTLNTFTTYIFSRCIVALIRCSTVRIIDSWWSVSTMDRPTSNRRWRLMTSWQRTLNLWYGREAAPANGDSPHKWPDMQSFVAFFVRCWEKKSCCQWFETHWRLVCSNVSSGADQRKYQNFASVTFVRGIHRWPLDSPHKRPVTHKMFLFDYVIMATFYSCAIWMESHPGMRGTNVAISDS